MHFARIHGPVLATTAIVFLLPPPAAAAKQREDTGWTCSIDIKKSRYYWFPEARTGRPEKGAVYRETRAGTFILTTRFRVDPGPNARMTPLTLEIGWTTPGNDRIPDQPWRRVELIDRGASKWDDPLEATKWFRTRPMASADLTLRWQALTDWASAYPALDLSVRDYGNDVVEQQALPDGILAAPKDETRRALLEMARLSKDFRDSKDCTYQEIEWIVVG